MICGGEIVNVNFDNQLTGTMLTRWERDLRVGGRCPHLPLVPASAEEGRLTVASMASAQHSPILNLLFQFP